MEKILTPNIELNTNTVSLYIRREDLIPPFVASNKSRKLKYHLLQAQLEKKTTLLTFGGAFSNHIAAVAAAGKEFNFKTIGVIRGEELRFKIEENPTLRFAHECGMLLEFVTREAYKSKNETSFIEALKRKFGNFYLLPEGGTNTLAVKGCEEILTNEDAVFDYICCAVGTGGTICGVMNRALSNQKILGFPVLKGDFLMEEIYKFTKKENAELITDYHFEGYGKVNEVLIEFINTFYKQNNIPLDPIYTGKMMFGLFDLIEKNYFPKGTKILAIHTGGIQGIEGINQKLKSKKLPLIELP